MLACTANTYCIHCVYSANTSWRNSGNPNREKNFKKLCILVLNIKSVDELWYWYRIHFHIEATRIKPTFLTSHRELVLLLFKKCCSTTIPQVTATTIELIVSIETKEFQMRGEVGCSVILPLLTCSKNKQTCRMKKILGSALSFWGSHRVHECLSEEHPKQRQNESWWCHDLSHAFYVFSAGISDCIFEKVPQNSQTNSSMATLKWKWIG